jgi:hypothetical protein
VCHVVLEDPSFFRFLLRIDEEFAGETRRAACPHCGAGLHSARYPRKPRGCPVSVVEEYNRRCLHSALGYLQMRSPAPITAQRARLSIRRAMKGRIWDSSA